MAAVLALITIIATSQLLTAIVAAIKKVGSSFFLLTKVFAAEFRSLFTSMMVQTTQFEQRMCFLGSLD
jgi:hypothetical protein